VPLSAVDVLPALQTGLIDAVDASPLTVAAFQWFGVAHYMTDLPFAALTGAIIISGKTWQQIPEKWHSALQASVDLRTQRIADEIRYSDDDAVKVMQDHGLEIITITQEEADEWRAVVDEHVVYLRGTLVDSVMFDQVMALKAKMNAPGFKLP
jgi:TRAP-type C4-dicarboxylate transport system substrate-binding protein